jgi:zona occludens toxin
MITLITGAPGAGKSSALVSLLVELAKGREIYANGIPDLKVPHTPLPDPHTWPDTVPDGAAIVIDEVQNAWRPMGPGQKVPADIAALETHRHRGLDFFIITQGPRLVHSNVRALVGRHVHLRELGVLGRWWYEWPECNDQCATSWKNAPIKKRYRLNKETFGLYKSASVHVKPIRSFPKMLVVALAAVVGTVGLAYYSYTRIQARIAPPATKPAAVDAKAPGASLNGSVGTPAKPYIDDRTAFVPRVSAKPESAPAYDGLRQVAAMPMVSMALCRPDGCKCYTQQGTDAGLTNEECRDWFENKPFNPYVSPAPAQAVAPSVQPLPAVNAVEGNPEIVRGAVPVSSGAAPAAGVRS